MDALEKCSAMVSDWMLQNGLALNLDKSKVIMFGFSQAVTKSTTKSVLVGSSIAITDKVNSLSVNLD